MLNSATFLRKLRLVDIAQAVGVSIARPCLVILFAYTLGYFLVLGLPEFGAGVLGVSAADTKVVEQFRLDSDIPSSYPEAISRLLTGNLGKTIDKRTVLGEIQRAIAFSLPMLLVAIALLIISMALGGIIGIYGGQKLLSISRVLSLLPAYVPGYVAVGLVPVLSVSVLDNRLLGVFAVSALSAVVPASLCFGTVVASISTAMHSQYVFTLKAQGYSAAESLWLVAPTTIKQLMPTLANLVSTLLMVQIFVEAILAYPGIGSSLLQALLRTDINLILGYILIFSFIHAVLKEVSLVIVWNKYRQVA